MKKVKVSKEMAEALERVFEKSSESQYGREGYLIYNYILNGFSSENKILRQLSLEEITRLSFEGYEVEETKEDRLKRFYEASLVNNDNYDIGFRIGVKECLETFDLKLEGIND